MIRLITSSVLSAAHKTGTPRRLHKSSRMFCGISFRESTKAGISNENIADSRRSSSAGVSRSIKWISVLPRICTRSFAKYSR